MGTHQGHPRSPGFIAKVTVLIVLAFDLALCAQRGSAHPWSEAAAALQNSYEDGEIKLAIPSGWVVTSKSEPAIGPYSGGTQTATNNAKDKLVLVKGNYVFALAYDTIFASGVGRFYEMMLDRRFVEPGDCRASAPETPRHCLNEEGRLDSRQLLEHSWNLNSGEQTRGRTGVFVPLQRLVHRTT